MPKKVRKLIIMSSLLILLAGLSLHLLGCGQGAILSETAPTPHPFYIVSVSPTLGATGIPSTEDIGITFSNALLSTSEFFTAISTGGAHTAGLPIPFTDFIWLNGNKTASLSIEGWDDPQGNVQIITISNITDEFGNTLPAGTTLWAYGLAGAPPTYTIAGTATGGTAGKAIYVYAATTTEPSGPGDIKGSTSGTANPFDYTIWGLPTGEYYIIAIRDEDSSGMTGTTSGDYIGYYPSLASPATVEVPPSTSEVNFTLILFP